MIKRFITLFILGRKIARSDILSIITKFQEPPTSTSVPMVNKLENKISLKSKIREVS